MEVQNVALALNTPDRLLVGHHRDLGSVSCRVNRSTVKTNYNTQVFYLSVRNLFRLHWQKDIYTWAEFLNQSLFRGHHFIIWAQGGKQHCKTNNPVQWKYFTFCPPACHQPGTVEAEDILIVEYSSQLSSLRTPSWGWSISVISPVFLSLLPLSAARRTAFLTLPTNLTGETISW